MFSASADWTLCQLGYESEVQKRLNRRPYRLLSHLSDVCPVLHCHDFHVSVCHLHQYGGWDVSVHGSGSGVVVWKLSLQYFLLPSYLETSSTEQVTAITSSFTLYSFHLPHCPVCDQSHQSLSRECRIRSTDSRVFCKCRLDTLSARL